MATRIVPWAAAIAACLFWSGAAAAASLTVSVQGVRSDQGRVACALFSSAAGFPGRVAGARTQVLSARRGATCRFDGLTPGTYAVAVTHDANGNGRLDTNLFGIPTEAWGVSNNARPGMRAPRFAEAAFAVADGQNARISVAVSR